MFELDIGNYRGSLQVDEKDNKYYWRVDCDIEEEDWVEIPKYLYEALVKYNRK